MHWYLSEAVPEEDFLASHDLEDIISVIDGRDEIVNETKQSDRELREYIGNELKSLLDKPEFQYALSEHLPGDIARVASSRAIE